MFSFKTPLPAGNIGPKPSIEVIPNIKTQVITRLLHASGVDTLTIKRNYTRARGKPILITGLLIESAAIAGCGLAPDNMSIHPKRPIF